MEHVNSREEVEQALNVVLQDAKFAAAPQMSAFLTFVVMQTLDGKADRIKAYTVAVDALGKPATFDPQNDPSVRVLAKRLRDTLSAYYERTNGHKVMLRLHTGSYIPDFEAANSLSSSNSTTDASNVGNPDAVQQAQSIAATANVTPVTRSGDTNSVTTGGLNDSKGSHDHNKLAKH